MKLYKFRAFDNIEYTMDIIMKERLYCADYKSLNDPFEGLFSTIEMQSIGVLKIGGAPGIHFAQSCQKTSYKTIDQLPALEKPPLICSLSCSMSDVRMWSLYASGHTGCAIEVDLEVEGNKIVGVTYDKGIRHFKNKLRDDTKAVDILSFKTNHWEYEKEYRIFSEEKFYSVNGKITGIYLGFRVQDIHKDLIVRCTPKEIPIYETRIEEKTVEIIPNVKVN